MSGLVTLEVLANGVAVIKIDNPPLNVLSRGVPEGIQSALGEAKSDTAVRALVLIGGGRTFIAGADINELATTAGPPNFHALLREIEDCPKPIVAALHGTALGGGLEIAMAAHYRVAVPDAMVGQPEVNLGIIPGAEGTQRLPRLAGIAKAIEMCVSGAPLIASEALEAGIIDRMVSGDLLAGAAEFALQMAAGGGAHPKTRERNEKLRFADERVYEAGRQTAKKTRRNQKAPLAAIEAIEAAASFPFDEGCRRERQLFSECASSDQAKGYDSRIPGRTGSRAKIPGIARDAAVRKLRARRDCRSRNHGLGIAMAFANAGISVRSKTASSKRWIARRL